ncbi:D-glycerate dehydrogenase [Alphaproteobacteria bacterium HT1-32]|nr:D-glycerate dehydrogenase [Alphaproteobacteria bacterium HT1-32]
MSDKPVLLIPRKLSARTLERAARDYDVRVNLEDQVYTPAELLAKCQDVDAVLPCHSEHFSADMVARLPDRLKIIANHSVGVDHCDLKACKDRGIIVTNTPDVLSDATAEIAMLLLLGAARRASEGDRMMRNGEWKHWSPSFMVGSHVTGKTLGIIGMGRVGQAMARCARGFNMDIHYYNRSRLSPEKELGATYHDTVESVLAVSNFLSLHCPATPETTGLLNAQRIGLMPDGAVVVNTARGALIDEPALIAALKSGKLAAAGLDVFAKEPGGNPAFAELENIFMLPHIGSATFETRDAMGFRALDNIDAYFAGKQPGDRVA